MNWTDGPALVGAVIAVVAAVGTFIAFLLSLRERKAADAAAGRAEAAAERANDARDRAADALEQANALTEAAAVRDDEDWFVEWRSDWSVHANVLSLTNWGKDPARTPSAVITGPQLHRVITPASDVVPTKAIEVEMPEIHERRHRDERQGEEDVRELLAAGIFYARGSYKEDLKIVMRWRTGQGRIQEQVLFQPVT